MTDTKKFKPSYALCPLPVPTPNTTWTHLPCGAEFYTDETGEYWLHNWCTDHGKPDDCPGSVMRSYPLDEYVKMLKDQCPNCHIETMPCTSCGTGL